MSIKNRAYKVIADHLELDVRDLKDTDCLTTDYGLDSLDHIELLMQFEDEFAAELNGNTIPDELLSEKVSLTLKDSADLLQSFIETLT